MEVDTTAALASEINVISKKVTMSTATNDTSEDEEAAEPMDVEEDTVYAKRHDDDMEISGPDKTESEKMANDDWNQLGEAHKARSNQEKIVRDATKTYQKAKRSDYVKECRTGVQQRKRDWKKAEQRRVNRVQMCRCPRPRRDRSKRRRFLRQKADASVVV